MSYLTGNSERVKGVRVTKDGIPIALGDLIPLVRGSDLPVFILPSLNIVLWGTRALRLGRLPDLKPIIQPAVQVPGLLGKHSVDF
jgi:hypothetical protein